MIPKERNFVYLKNTFLFHKLKFLQKIVVNFSKLRHDIKKIINWRLFPQKQYPYNVVFENKYCFLPEEIEKFGIFKGLVERLRLDVSARMIFPPQKLILLW